MRRWRQALSAELRAKVAASKVNDRYQVVINMEDE